MSRRRWGVFLPYRREDVEVEHRLVADHLAPVQDVWRNLQEAAGTQHDTLFADVEADPPGDDVDDLLVAVGMRIRFVLGHELVQRDGRAVAGERLARDPFAHRFPWNILPVDLVQVHEFLRYPVSPRVIRSRSLDGELHLIYSGWIRASLIKAVQLASWART